MKWLNRAVLAVAAAVLLAVGTQGALATPQPVTSLYPNSATHSSVARATISATEIKNLAATPITIIPATGAGTFIEIDHGTIKLVAGSEVLVETTDNLSLRYGSGGADAVVAIETTNWIDSTVDEYTFIRARTNPAGVVASTSENTAIVLQNTGGEFTGNASDDASLELSVVYRVLRL